MHVLILDPYLINEHKNIELEIDKHLVVISKLLRKNKINYTYLQSCGNNKETLLQYIDDKSPDLIITNEHYLQLKLHKSDIKTEVAVLRSEWSDKHLQEGHIDYIVKSHSTDEVLQFVLNVLPPKSLFLDVLTGISYRNKLGEISKKESVKDNDFDTFRIEQEELPIGSYLYGARGERTIKQLISKNDIEALETPFDQTLYIGRKSEINLTTLEEIINLNDQLLQTSKYNWIRKAFLKTKIKAKKNSV